MKGIQERGWLISLIIVLTLVAVACGGGFGSTIQPIQPSIELRVGTNTLNATAIQEDRCLANVPMDDLAKTSLGEDKWSDVNPGWPDEEILCATLSIGSRVIDFLVEARSDRDKDPSVRALNSQLSTDSNVLGRDGWSSPCAIDFFDRVYQQENADALKELSVKHVGPTSKGANNIYPLTNGLSTHTATVTYAVGKKVREVFVRSNTAAAKHITSGPILTILVHRLLSVARRVYRLGCKWAPAISTTTPTLTPTATHMQVVASLLTPTETPTCKPTMNWVVSTTIPLLSQELLDRCNLIVSRIGSGQEALTDRHLQAIGKRVRTWRIQHGYARSTLAKQLGMEPDRLLFLENKIGLPGDVTAEQLLHIQRLLEEGDQGNTGQLVPEHLCASRG